MKKSLRTLFIVLAASLTVAFAQTGGTTTGGADMAAQMENMPEQTLQELRDLYEQLGRLIAELEGQMGVTGGEGLAERQISSGGELESRAEALTLDESGGGMTGGEALGEQQISSGGELESRAEALTLDESGGAMTGGVTGGMTGGEALAEQQISSGGELESRAEALTLDESGGAMTGGGMTGGMGEAPTLEGTISALEGGVSNLALEAALSNIQGWQTTLNDAGYNDLADELGQLASALQAEPVDQDEVSGLLLSLGAQTTAAADNAIDSDASSQLAQLGSLLTALGNGEGVTGGSN